MPAQNIVRAIPTSVGRASLFCAMEWAAVLPIYFYSLDFFCRSQFLIDVSGMAPKALIWFFFLRQDKRKNITSAGPDVLLSAICYLLSASILMLTTSYFLLNTVQSLHRTLFSTSFICILFSAVCYPQSAFSILRTRIIFLNVIQFFVFLILYISSLQLASR